MQRIVKTVTLVYNNLPRPHRIMLGSLTGLTALVAVWQPSIYTPTEEQADHVYVNTSGIRELPQVIDIDITEPMDQPNPDDDIPQDELDQKMEAPTDMQEYLVSAGDTLGNILTQYGIDMNDVALLSKSSSALRNLKVGQQISWTLNDDGELQTLDWVVTRRESRSYQRVGDSYVETIENKEGEWKNSTVTGTLDGSFVSSAKSAGLTSTEVHSIIKALQWQLDFKKLRKGDKFAALFSREYLDGKKEQSQLIAVRLNSAGKDYYAVLADDGKFYDTGGTGLARGFMRFPTIKQFRVSSNFNPRRLNPVTGRVAPHKGVDFSMPVGTPILAAGDGEVVLAKQSGAAGNYIIIRHGRQYSTRYMHLKKLLVKPGQKVKRGERIALSGNSGRSTGPHLHYEFWVNNQAVNPLTAKLPRSDGLSGKERSEFLAQVKRVTPQLQLD